MRHPAIYTRVSSKKQDHASQMPDLERWAKAQEGEVRIYRDKFTGKSMERPGWSKLWAAVERGEVSKIVVWRLDRLGRTAAGLTKLFADLQERKVGLVSLKDGIDLSTPAGRMLANVLASIAQFETELRGERVRRPRGCQSRRQIDRWPQSGNAGPTHRGEGTSCQAATQVGHVGF